MSDFSDFVNVIGQQNTLSGIQDYAKKMGDSGQLDPQTAQLLQDSPRLGLELIPQMLQQQMSNKALASIYQPSGTQSAPTSALAQYAGSGDTQPNAPVPGGVGLSSPPSPTATQPQATGNGGGALDQLHRLQAANVIGHGNIADGLKALSAAAIPPGAAPPPENYQYVNGQLQKVTGAAPSAAQQEIDKNFGESWQTYNNAGGAERVKNSLAVIDQTINQLQNGTLTTGGPIDRMAMRNGEQTAEGQMFDAPLLTARNNIAAGILPQAKALFGSRVTNFDAQSIVNSKGLDPMGSTEANIAKLQRLKNEVLAGQQDVENSGQYFQDHSGTLNGYQNPNASSLSPHITDSNNKVDPAFIASGKARGFIQ